jgi:cation diffusion facilitator family transporter
LRRWNGIGLTPGLRADSLLGVTTPDESDCGPTGPGRTREIVIASWVGIIGNGILAVLKLLVGVYAHSIAVVSDGVDSAIDIFTSAISLVAARIVAKPPDLNHPYGHMRAETIAAKTFSFIIFFAGAQLAISTVTHLVQGQAREVPGTLAIYVTIVSVIGKTGLFIHKYWVGRRTESAMLIADAKNMRGDIAVSLGVLLGLGFTYLLDMPMVDSVTAIVISVWIMYIAFKIFLETNVELMEGYEDTSLYPQIFDAVESVPGAHHPHRTRIRTIGALRIVDLDIEVDGELTVSEAHEISRGAEAAIRACVSNVYDVLVHVEPTGNVEETEPYGVSRRKLADGCPDPDDIDIPDDPG